MFASETSAPIRPPRVLVVDDEPALRRLHERVLRSAGFDVTSASDGVNAAEALRVAEFDVVVSDVSMPGLDGLGLIQAARALGVDASVVLVTGHPTREAADDAVRAGALCYLKKPLAAQTLVNVVAHASSVRRYAREEGCGALTPSDRAARGLLAAAFDGALAGLSMAMQPIVDCRFERVFGYEALLRTKEPRLPNPGLVLDAAERLGRLDELGRAVRAKVAAIAETAPEGPLIFVNLHPRDLADPELYDPTAPLSAFAPRVMLELTERSALAGIAGTADRIDALRRLGYRVAIDDLGAGYAGLSAFAELKPDLIKIDASLVRDIDTDLVKQRLVHGLIGICRETNLDVVTEGVETAGERDALTRMGADLMQGYLFARPGPGLPRPTW